MLKKSLKSLSILLFLLFGVGGGSGLLALVPSLPFQTQGEHLKFKITYADLTGGYVSIVTRPVGDKLKIDLYGTSTKWVASVYNLKLYLSSTLDRASFQSLRFIASKRENDRLEYDALKFNWSEKTVVYSDRRNRDEVKQQTIDFKVKEGTDVLGLIYWGRIIPLEMGATYPLTVFLKNNIRKAVLEVLRKERVEIEYREKLRSVDTIVVEPKMNYRGLMKGNQSFEIYLSDDAYKVPVLMEVAFDFGSVKIELVEGHPDWLD